MPKMKQPILALVILLTPISATQAQEIDLSDAGIIVSANIKTPVRTTLVKTLKEEIGKRTSLEWQQHASWREERNALIAICLSSEKTLLGRPVPQRKGRDWPEQRAEGYRLVTETQAGQNIVWIIGADALGTLFGVGQLLRTAVLKDEHAYLPEAIHMASVPMQAIRGHQLGYRNTANSYDAWDVGQYEQYIRELVLFGTNAIENIPFQDGNESVHMPVTRAEMNIRLSEICKAYDIDYWVWTPATFDLRDAEKRSAMLDTHEQFYKACARLDQIFFPGGDPGHNHPREVMPFLKDLSVRLHRHHPQAGIWISLQGFSAEQIDYFYTYLNQHQPDWLRGVISGPSSPPIAETRHRLPREYQHRQYPDITHNVRCEFPVFNWDQTYMLTIGREGINPRPHHYAKIHATYAPFTDGFVTYSDGVHDDVNKIIWSMRGWDSNREVRDILIEYCRFFFGAALAENAADGILALERNWDGPIKANGGIETTLAYWQTLEKAHPQLACNWRWQMLALRAYYDSYQRRRKIYEQALEKEANQVLARARSLGPKKAMDRALAIVKRAESEPVAQDLHAKIVTYCDDLFRSVGLQTSVPKYQASSAERGCMLQFVNYPLNNRWWLADEFAQIKALDSDAEKLARLHTICRWENPGPGSYYDNVSNIETGPRVQTRSMDACDVAWWDSGNSRARLSAQLFQGEPVLDYDNLDFNGRYIIRVCGQGDALIRADGERLDPVLYNKTRGGFKEFVIPKQITRDGKLRISFDRPEESHLNWRQYSHVSDVWLIKR